MFKSVLTPPKLCKPKKVGMYIRHKKVYKLGFNSIDDLIEREHEFNELIRLLKHKIKNENWVSI